jgi:hypothetical protein
MPCQGRLQAIGTRDWAPAPEKLVILALDLWFPAWQAAYNWNEGQSFLSQKTNSD